MGFMGWRHRAGRGSTAEYLAVFLLLAAHIAPGLAANRCVTPSGRVLYTDESCESVGARRERDVKEMLQVVPPQAGPAAAPRAAPPTRDAAPATKVFRKAANSPVLTFCYDARDARAEVGTAQIESAIRAAASLWNAGCNVNYEFLGACAAEAGRADRVVDYRVWWASWDDTLKSRETDRSFREHAIAAASPQIGIALNRDIAPAVFVARYRRSIVHEFGHVVGIGHSPNLGDIMFSGGEQATPTQSDLETCNRAVEARFGVKSAP
jgi:hypothetical protein